MGFFITPVFAQEITNPSLIIDSIEIPAEKFNAVLRDTPIIPLNAVHAISWQVTIDNNLLYANPDGNAVLILYDSKSGELKKCIKQQPNESGVPTSHLQMLQSSVDRASESIKAENEKRSPPEAELTSRMAAMAAMFPNLPTSIAASLGFPSSQSK